MKEYIKPSIRTDTGKIIYPTGDEWLVFFAVAGCEWAIKALAEKKEEAK